MSCPHCKAAKTNARARKTKQGYATFYCPACQHTFNERTGHALNFCHYPSDLIFLVVLWRFRYKVSLRDLAEMFLVRGSDFSRNGQGLGKTLCSYNYGPAKSKTQVPAHFRQHAL